MDAATKTLVDGISRAIVNPLLALIFAIGMLVFVYGIVEFLIGLSTDVGEGKEKGKQHMLWGVVGMFVMASAYAILTLIANTVCGGGGLGGCTAK